MVWGLFSNNSIGNLQGVVMIWNMQLWNKRKGRALANKDNSYMGNKWHPWPQQEALALETTFHHITPEEVKKEIEDIEIKIRRCHMEIYDVVIDVYLQ